MTTAITIDSDDEDVVARCRQFREGRVYPALQGAGAALTPFGGIDAQRSIVAPVLRSSAANLITGSGHGFPERFTGQGRDPIFAVGAYDPAEVSGRIVHLLSCETAQQLGPDLVANGCRAFFGYDEVFVFPDMAADLFLVCDGEIDTQLAQGRTADEAYQAAIAAFNLRIAQMLQLGKTFVAAALARNRDHLCAPSTSSRFGDPNATAV